VLSPIKGYPYQRIILVVARMTANRI